MTHLEDRSRRRHVKVGRNLQIRMDRLDGDSLTVIAQRYRITPQRVAVICMETRARVDPCDLGHGVRLVDGVAVTAFRGSIGA